MEINENEITTLQNLSDTAKAVLKGKCITTQASIQKLERNQIQKLTLHLKELEKKTANRSYTQQKKRVNQDSSRTPWNRDQKNCGTDQQKQELVLWKDKIDKPLASFIKKKREKTQINKIMNEKGEITTNTKETQMI